MFYHHDQKFAVLHADHMYIEHLVHNNPVMDVPWDGNILALIACIFQIATADEKHRKFDCTHKQDIAQVVQIQYFWNYYQDIFVQYHVHDFVFTVS